MPANLNDDPRWRLLNQLGWVCSGCGQMHRGLFDLACDKPDFWEGELPQPDATVRIGKSFLSSNLCVIDDEYFYVRCVLLLPIVGLTGEHFGFGVWSSLSRENFSLCSTTWNDDDQGRLGPWFGWFANELKGYPDTCRLKCRVQPQNARERPLIELEPTDHPLAREQREGITLDRIFELYALNGHDPAGALSR